jgi:hypothetical protein
MDDETGEPVALEPHLSRRPINIQSEEPLIDGDVEPEGAIPQRLIEHHLAKPLAAASVQPVSS